MKFVAKGLIDNFPALVKIVAWRGTGDKPLFEQMLAYVADTYMRHLWPLLLTWFNFNPSMDK